MRNLEVIVMFPMAIISLLLLMVIDLARAAKGKQTADEELHEIYVNVNLNHGQGRKEQ